MLVAPIALMSTSVSAAGMGGMSASSSSVTGPQAKVVSDPGNVSSGANPCAGSFTDPAVTYAAPPSIPYLDSTTPYKVGEGSSSFFTISPTGPTSSKAQCAITSCKLFGPHCQEPLNHPHIKIQDKAPFQITADTNVRGGYSVEFCVACWSAGYTKADYADGYAAAENTTIT